MSQESEISVDENIGPTSVEEIDDDILADFPGINRRKENIREDVFYGRPPRQLIVDDENGQKFKSVDTSKFKNDCLIHAFLIDVSLNFRKLDQDQKNKYADKFRRQYFVNWFDEEDEAVERKEVAGLGFLGEAHVQKLIDITGINILVFEKAGGGVRTSLNLGGLDDARENEDFIIIYNPGDLHFRGVRQMPSGRYMFPYDEGMEIAERHAVGKDGSIPRVCPYEDGEKVVHLGEVKTIFERVWADRGDKTIQCVGVRFVEGGPVERLESIRKATEADIQAPAAPAAAAAAAAAPSPESSPSPSPEEESESENESENESESDEEEEVSDEETDEEEEEVEVSPSSESNSSEEKQQTPSPTPSPEVPPTAAAAPSTKPKTPAPLPSPAASAAAAAAAPSGPSYPVGKTREEILKQWTDEKDFANRDVILRKMKEDRIFPEAAETALENEVGLYPDVKDPNFVAKLLEKREFAESKQPSIKQQIDEGVNPCDPEQEFEITPVQRFVSRLLNPYTPYTSALLYHGVGVGKTCAAITISEGYLEKYPRDQVYIIAPPNIQPGFERTIFDFDGLKIGKGVGDSESESEMNTAKGCTGNTYLKLSGTLFEQDRKLIESRVRTLIRRRYKLMGYTQFANEIEAFEKKVPPRGGADLVNDLIRKTYSGKVIIIDEAHNLRDIPDETEEENLDVAGGYGELSDAAAGKKLTPFLRRLLTVAEGVTLVLLTGTPMYNSYSEIIFLLNLLLLNEKRVGELLTKDKIFESNGQFKPGGRARLGEIAGRYVSFMRGENPLTFPTRLKPLPGSDVSLLTEWPTKAPNGKPIDAPGTEPSVSEIQRANRFELPIVQCYFQGPNAAAYKAYTEKVAAMGLGIQNANALIQAGNWIFPGEEDEPIDTRIRNDGFDNEFASKMEAKQIVFRGRNETPTWLIEENIGTVSPKSAVLLNRLRTCRGCAFVYSRFVKSGALSIALALEANGYTLWGREKGFLGDGVLAPGGLQCARCPRKKDEHVGTAIDHKFLPAKYILLTGSEEYSPNNPAAIAAQRRVDNLYGEQIKVVVGSQVVSEGVDLRFIREIYIFDSWFHLNKLEQVVGRGIRTCSHSLFPDPKLRNCTNYLLVNAFEPEADGTTRETMDLYTYRRAIRKAVEVGRVTRVLKEYATDCNLNHDAILVTGLKKVNMIDAQGNPREADQNDTPFTALCDWEECDSYKCIPDVPVNPETASEKTYTEFAAKWQEQKLMDDVRKLFQEKAGGEEQAFVTVEDFMRRFKSISRKSLSILLQTILKSKSFYIQLAGKNGHIIYKNGYFLFQPIELKDDTIPLALRIAPYPVKRDTYPPEKYAEVPEAPKVLPKADTAAAAAPSAKGKAEPVVAAAAEEDTDTKEIVQDLWKTVAAWADSIRTKTAVTKDIPPAVLSAINIFHNRDEKLLRRSMERLGMITWLYISIQANDGWRNHLANIVEEIIWDEFLSPTDQRGLLDSWKKSAADMEKYRHVYQEHWLTSGSTNAFRFVDYRTGTLRYICGEKECTDLQKSVLEESDSNPLKAVTINTSNTGFLYGFLVPKKGELIFKNVTPPTGANKVEKGQECSISSQVSDHLRKLKELGAVFQTEKGTDLDLNEKELTGARKFENAVRACFLMDLVLRLMDKEAISRKRWMYKSISAKMAGHKGTFEKGVAAGANA